MRSKMNQENWKEKLRQSNVLHTIEGLKDDAKRELPKEKKERKP